MGNTKKSIIDIYFLHGFLGQTKDWQNVVESIKSLLKAKNIVYKYNDNEHTPIANGSSHQRSGEWSLQKSNELKNKFFLNPNLQLTTNQLEMRFFLLDYFNISELSPENGFDPFAKNFLSLVSESSEHTSLKILVGYSLGGRLALNVLDNDEDGLIDQMLLISTNPGLEDHDLNQKKEREQSDTEWSQKFGDLNYDWLQLITDWNALGVFKGAANSIEPQRLESDFNRVILSQALTSWSLSKQKDLKKLIQNRIDKLKLLVGENDSKFVNIYHNFLDASNFIVVKQSGHRVLFDRADAVSEVLLDLIERKNKIC